MQKDEELKNIVEKYKKRISPYIEEVPAEEIFSKEYKIFKEEVLSKRRSIYEKLCNGAENLIKFAPSEKDISSLEKAISMAHLDITPVGASSFAASMAFLSILFGLLIAIFSFLITEKLSLFFPFLFVILGLIFLKFLTNLPIYLAAKWRLAASNQMVLCILYIVMYMRHTSNLEHAIRFTTQHIGAPLSLDLRKIFWDMEIRKFSTIKESLDNYLESWRDYNLEFVTSFHLIESSLYEPSEERRLTLLDKSLEVILEGTYEKMLHYAHGLKNPITMLHMLGVVLPILGLVIFPLAGSFLGGLIKWYHLAFLYNLILPILVYSLGMNTLSKRPTGYGETKFGKDLLQTNFAYSSFCFLLASVLLIIGLFPLLMHFIQVPDFEVSAIGKFLDYQQENGPFGIPALLLSFFVPASIAFSLGLYFKKITKGIIKIREETKKLEQEFASSLFQLGNRIGDGIPTELAFGTVAKNMASTPAGNFFVIVDNNIRVYGMSVYEAIFNQKIGAILSYPSSLIESSMEVLLESSKKGPNIVSQSLISISNYIDRIHKVNERINDLLSEIISSMKSQISFLAPAIAGIVVGISSMIVEIIVGLNIKFAGFAEEGALGTQTNLATLTSLFNIKDIIPSYFFQFVVGIYIVQIIYILTVLSNSIETGSDKIYEKFTLGKNLIAGTLLYIAIAFITVILFHFLAKGVMVGAAL